MERTSALSKMQSQPKNKKNISKELAKLKTWKGDLGNRERPGGLKSEILGSFPSEVAISVASFFGGQGYWLAFDSLI